MSEENNVVNRQRNFYLDIEANALLGTVSKVWIIGLKDLDTGEEFIFTDEGRYGYASVKEFPKFCRENVKTFSGHNIIGYDLPVLNLLCGTSFDYNDVRFDTLILSRLIDFDVEGGHSLRNLSSLAGGVQKQEYEGGFEDLSEEMISYNIYDLRSGVNVLKWLKKKGTGTPLSVISFEQKVQWYCNEIRDLGFKLDIPKTEALLAEVASMSDAHANTLTTLYPKIPRPAYKEKGGVAKVTKYRLKADGSQHPLNYKSLDGYATKDQVVGSYTRIVWEQFNPSSRQQVVWQLLHKGWKPEKFTETGTPSVDGDVLDELAETFPECKDIADYFLLEKRRGQIKSWLELVNRDTSRVHGSISAIGARTHRASHANPNLAQVPGVILGKDDHPIKGFDGKFNYECRDCWVAEEGYSIVGVDASAIQLVVLAHCMDDENFTKAVSEGKKSDGSDVHTFNRNILRDAILSITNDKEAANSFSRPNAKTYIYAFLLGAGNAKLASICSLDAKYGKSLREEFLERLPKLKQYLDRLKGEVKKNKKIRSIDGRLYPCDDPHFALAYILQGYEALIMKLALVKTHEWLKEKGYGGIVTWVHDEFQMEIKKGFEDEVIKKVVEFITTSAKDINFRCPLTGEGSYGTSWACSH